MKHGRKRTAQNRMFSYLSRPFSRGFFNRALALLRIHLLHQHGIEGAEKTGRASLPVSANLVGTYDENIGASIARPHGRNNGYLKYRKDKAA